QILRVVVLPVLAICTLFFHCIHYCRDNTKRFDMLAMTGLLFVVYSSFSFPLFISGLDSEQTWEELDEFVADISLVEEEIPDISVMEILDDEDVMEEGDESRETVHGLDTDKYNAEEVLKFTEGREDNVTEEEESLPVTEFSEDDWKIVLVNKQHSIPDDYTFELGNITSTMKCDERIIDDLRKMLKAAEKDSINLVIRSPYRDTARQEMLFARKINKYMNKGMSFVEAYRLSSQAVTVPGASEHQIGLAFDITGDDYSNLDEGFGDTQAGIWLAENSYKFGFILRYPLGKEYITGIEYEPWHFRYVGTDAATVIHKDEITLEEFWEEYVTCTVY
ncbi:MAG: M15 family metallopeptidase, partial [Acetatifactor sp.]|nr:M15 family metallopeptidase [Acetatifactor sp.]